MFGFGGPAQVGMLLEMPEVQKELALSDEQKTKIQSIRDEQEDQMRAGFDSFNPQELDDLSDEQREERFAAMRKRGEEAAQKANDKIKETLDAKQFARLEQLRLQREGARALLRPEVSEKLALSDAQRKDLEEKLPQGGPGGFGPPGFGPPGGGPGGPGGRGFGPPGGPQGNNDAALAVLTDAQRTQFAELKGLEFKFPEMGFGGPGGPGGPMGQERKYVAKFDANKDGWLNTEERKLAREAAKAEPARGPGGRGGPGGRRRGPGGGPGGPGGFGRGNEEPGKPGPKVSPADVASHGDKPLYDPSVIRTLFIDFESPDWREEMGDFYRTDVEVPATLTIDGKTYPQVGLSYRGQSSYFTVDADHKRSLNLTVDLAGGKQRVLGYKTLNLLNAHEDPTYLHTVLYSHLARKHMPAPQANFVKVVINGESWGLFVNAQQFNKESVSEWYGDGKAARWKVPGSPGGRAGLNYLGDNVEDYKKLFDIKTKDDEASWQALIKLCKTLDQTPLDKLEEELAPQLDIDEALWFLALENVLVNGDGYWVRASDYSLVRDAKGKFHVIPHDMNEAFQPAMGPGMFGGGRRGGGRGPGGGGRGPGGPGGGGPGGPGGGRADLDPLVGLDDASKPLRSRLLAVPSLKKKYLEHVRTLASEIDWSELGPVVAQYRALIEPELAADTRKLASLEEFHAALGEGSGGDEGPRRKPSLPDFVRQRREFLLNHPEIKALDSN
jgi:Spy/CpxP family protein refolding chaperone